MKTEDEKEYGKRIINFGKWIVTTKGILWKPKVNAYFIDCDRLWEARPDKQRDKFDWPLHLVEKTWLTESDIYQLNTAFSFALDYFKELLPDGDSKLSLWKTFKEQQFLLKVKREDFKYKEQLVNR
jgi:hypothetical protein